MPAATAQRKRRTTKTKQSGGIWPFDPKPTTDTAAPTSTPTTSAPQSKGIFGRLFGKSDASAPAADATQPVESANKGWFSWIPSFGKSSSALAADASGTGAAPTAQAGGKKKTKAKGKAKAKNHKK